MAYEKAVRKAVPTMVELASVSGGGKTTTGLLLAAGMAGSGRVGMLDSENGRGSLPADEKIIIDALPNGYEYDELSAPFTPERYIEKIEEAENAGIDVLCIDSTSHEYAGFGGVSDIAEPPGKKANWAPAKLRHKRFLNHCLSSRMDIIFCFRAQSKVKIIGSGRDQQFIDMGVLPIQEKNWSFDMTFRWNLEDKTHLATLIKAPRSLEDRGLTGRLLTKADGLLLREWKLNGKVLDPIELIQKRARSAAEDGLVIYTEFFGSLTIAQKKILAETTHSANKRIAEQADLDAEQTRLQEIADGQAT